jgi:hypothetical protein
VMEERRKLPRYIFGSTGKLSSSGTSAPSEVSVLVLSAEGALVECRTPLAVGEICTLNIAWEGSTITVSAVVRSRENTGTAGLMFLGVDEESQTRLKQICSALPLDIHPKTNQPQK